MSERLLKKSQSDGLEEISKNSFSVKSRVVARCNSDLSVSNKHKEEVHFCPTDYFSNINVQEDIEIEVLDIIKEKDQKGPRILKCKILNRKTKTNDIVALKVFDSINKNVPRIRNEKIWKFVYSNDIKMSKDRHNNISKQVIKENFLITNKLKRHENLIELFESFIYKETLYISMECFGINLNDYIIKKKYNIEYKEIVNIIKDISFGILYLHINGIIHKDIHPGNILTDGIKTKLCDFGSACFTDKQQIKSFDSLITYCAPEIISQSQSFSYKTDIYSCGCSVIVLVNSVISKNLFEMKTQYNSDIVKNYERSHNDNRYINCYIHKDLKYKILKKLISDMTKLDPIERIGSDQFNSRVVSFSYWFN